MIFPSTTSIIFGIIFGLSISTLAYFGKALSLSGAIAAAILGSIVFGLGGYAYTAVLLIFFITSSGLSFAFKRRKKDTEAKHAKGSRRDAGQVLANGGIAGLLVILHFFIPEEGWVFWAYSASFAAANADTWATELGVLSKSAPRLILTGKTVEMGTSGGVTRLGTLAALSGAFIVALTGYLFQPVNPIAILAVTLAGLVGSLVDSILGATVQAVFFCPTCNKETEKSPSHVCGTKTQQIRGFRYFDNDVVNGVCTLSGAILIGVIAILGRL